MSTEIQLGTWGQGVGKDELPVFVLDTGVEAEKFHGCQVVAPLANRERIDALLCSGANKVLLGDTALKSHAFIKEVVKQYSGDRIGVWLSVRRSESNWSLDRQSNADFSFVSVSSPQPRWMMQRNDGSLTDVDALWWAGEMIKAGCSSVVVSVNEPEDDDLLVCAEMSEIATDCFWLDARTTDVEELRFWVKYGHARQLLLPVGADSESVLARLNSRLNQELTVG